MAYGVATCNPKNNLGMTTYSRVKVERTWKVGLTPRDTSTPTDWSIDGVSFLNSQHQDVCKLIPLLVSCLFHFPI